MSISKPFGQNAGTAKRRPSNLSASCANVVRRGFAALAFAVAAALAPTPALATNYALLPAILPDAPAVGATITFPNVNTSITTLPAGLTNSLPSGTFNFTPASSWAFTAKVTATAAKTNPGSVTLTGLELYVSGQKADPKVAAYKSYYLNILATPTIPEFIWVYDSKAGAVLPYRVTLIAKDFLKDFDVTESGARPFKGAIKALYFGGSIPTFEEGFITYDLLGTSLPGESSENFTLHIEPPYVTVGTDNTLTAGGAYYFGEASDGNQAVIGGLQVANQLNFFSDTKDKRDRVLTKTEFASLFNIIKDFAKPTITGSGENTVTTKTSQVSLQFGRSATAPATIPSTDVLTLGDGLFDIENIDLYIKQIYINTSIKADLAAIKYNALFASPLRWAQLFDINPKNVDLHVPGLFAGAKGSVLKEGNKAPYDFLVQYIEFPNNALTYIPDNYFKDATVGIADYKSNGGQGSAEALKKVTYIGTSAFEGARFFLATPFHAETLDSIAPRAFYNASQVNPLAPATLQGINIPQLASVTTIGDSAFANISSLEGFSSLTNVTALGAGVFAGSAITVTPTSLAQQSDQSAGTALSGVYAFTLPFTKPFAAPANVFKGAKFGGVDGAVATFILGSQATPSAAPKPHADLHPDAFAGATLYVPLDLLQLYTDALPSATVLPYDLPKIPDTNDKVYAKVITKNGATIPNWTVTFADIKKANHRLVFTDDAKATEYFTITGPATPGFTTADTARLLDELTDLGIDLLDLPLVAGFYTIKLFYTDAADATPAHTFVLTVSPTDLTDDYKADSITIAYSGDAAATLKVLATFDSTALKIFNAAGTYFDLSSVKLNPLVLPATLTIPALTADEDFSTIDPSGIKVSFAGNSVGEFDIPLKITQTKLTPAVLLDVPNLNFNLKAKSYDLAKEGALATIAGVDTFDYTVKIYAPDYKFSGEEGAAAGAVAKPLAYVTVKYKDGKVPTGLGTHPIWLIGHGYLTDSVATSFEVQAGWSDIATISTNPNDYKLGQTATFNGSVLYEDFTGLVKTDLPADDYFLAATPKVGDNTDLTHLDNADLKLSDFTDGPIYDAGSYSFYLIPAGKYLAPTGTYKLTDAVYVGFITVTPLEATALTDAAVLSVAPAPDSEEEPADDAVEAPVKYLVSFGKVFLGTPDSVVTTVKDILVYFNETDAKSISGLTGDAKNILTLQLPQGEPSALNLEPLPKDANVWSFEAETGSLDLFTTFKPAGTPALDWKSRISFILSALDAKHFTITDGILSSIDGNEWAGSITILYTFLDPKKAGKSELREKISVTAFTDTPPPTSVEAILAGDAPATFYTLSGVALKGIPTTPGLYLLRSGSKVTKLLIKK
ncbi:MAG: leucine-rich repeat domain-containing protein [Tannerellaceae bacterium]|nr:leucine-rich repeat domain-containing protein [Tannerellaceae bacterium]